MCLATRRQVEVKPRGVRVTHSANAVAEAKLVVLAVSARVVGEVIASLSRQLDARHLVIHASRALVGGSLQTMSEFIREHTPVRHVGALGGPALAADLLAANPAVIVCGASSDELGHAFVKRFMSQSLRVYTTNDVRGIEWATALVGCLAIIVGYAQRIGLNPGIIAALITRGVQEASRIVAAAEGSPQTLLGLAGYGELLAAISQRNRPEVRLGSALARGLTIEQAARSLKSRVEAVEMLPRLVSWIKEHRVRAPIFMALASDVFAARPSEQIIDRLMTLPVEDAG